MRRVRHANNTKLGRLVFAVLTIGLVMSCASYSEDGSSSGGADASPAVGELGGMCGGIAGFTCNGENAYCKVEPGICKDTADFAGVCTIKPDICTREYRPVCGCDGRTYSNSCSAAGAGVSVAYTGACIAQN